MRASDNSIKIPPENKKADNICVNADVISFISGLGFPRENIIPCHYYIWLTLNCQ
jgi:hypothetical protein